MCDLFSWIKCKDGSIWYNTDKDIEREGLDYIDGIGHEAIEKIWKVTGEKCEGILKVPKQLALDVNRGKCAKMAKAAQWAGIHYDSKGCIDSPWWPKDFLKSIKKVKFFQPKKGFKLPDNWKVSETMDAAMDAARAAARDAARAAAMDAARDAAWDAAWDAALVALCFVSQKKDLMQYAGRRFTVWEAGYGLIVDIGGTFYVYKKP